MSSHRAPYLLVTPDQYQIYALQYGPPGSILNTEGPDKPKTGIRAYRRKPAVGSRRPGPAVVHSVAYLYPGWISVPNNPAGLML